MLACTIGTPYGWYTNKAAHGDIETCLWPIQVSSTTQKTKQI